MSKFIDSILAAVVLFACVCCALAGGVAALLFSASGPSDPSHALPPSVSAFYKQGPQASPLTEIGR